MESITNKYNFKRKETKFLNYDSNDDMYNFHIKTLEMEKNYLIKRDSIADDLIKYLDYKEKLLTHILSKCQRGSSSIKAIGILNHIEFEEDDIVNR